MNYKDGKYLKIYYCIDCNKNISKYSGIYGNHRCKKCSYLNKHLKKKLYYCKFGCGVVVSGKNKSCQSCYKLGKKRSKESIEKGKKTFFIRYGKNIKGGFQKGFKSSTSFKKGHIPWNKGIPGLSKEKHWNWKGGTTSIIQCIRNSLENKNWSYSVLKRDHFMCQECGQIGGNLEAHHKIELSVLVKEFMENIFINNLSLKDQIKNYNKFWDIQNGICLCIKCHHKKRNWMKRNNKGQFK